ncbi:MAG: hypothetical protein FK734_04725 [Asgard group archaeon]|nr:hypothetical protein [Asgard group archaeon]
MRSQWQSWLTIISIPIAYLLWIGYRIYIIGESILKTSNIQEIIYSIFISYSAKRVVPNQIFTLPLNTLYLGYIKLNSAPDLDIWINVILSILFLCTIVAGWKFMTTSFRLYSVIIFFVSFSYFTGPIHPLMGLARHLLLAFPIFIGISPFLEKRRLILWIYVIFNSILMLILLTAYTLNAWVP